MAADLPDYLVQYLAGRDCELAEAVQQTLAAMTERERRLVREAAVMGWSQGMRSVPGGHNIDNPPDSVIVARVIDGCLSMPDLYPVINSLT